MSREVGVCCWRGARDIVMNGDVVKAWPLETEKGGGGRTLLSAKRLSCRRQKFVTVNGWRCVRLSTTALVLGAVVAWCGWRNRYKRLCKSTEVDRSRMSLYRNQTRNQWKWREIGEWKKTNRDGFGIRRAYRGPSCELWTFFGRWWLALWKERNEKETKDGGENRTHNVGSKQNKKKR